MPVAVRQIQTDPALKALILARERQYRDVISRCAAFLVASGHSSCADLMLAMAATYGFADQQPAPATIEEPLNDLEPPTSPEKVQHLVDLIVTTLQKVPDVDHSATWLRSRVPMNHSQNTWAKALSAVRDCPNVVSTGTHTNRRFRWESQAAGRRAANF